MAPGTKKKSFQMLSHSYPPKGSLSRYSVIYIPQKVVFQTLGPSYPSKGGLSRY